MLSKKQLLTKGILDVAPHMLSVIPFGIICGAIGIELGFNLSLATPLMKSIISD